MGSKGKGDRFERDQAGWFREHDGIDSKVYSVTDSGRLGATYNGLGFDIPALSYSVECKYRESIPQWLMGAWEQVIEVNERECEQHDFDKAPLLALKKNYKPIMHVIEPERHAELLKYERECKNE